MPENKSVVRTRNTTLDFAKCFASICVILIHLNEFVVGGYYLSSVCKWAVPFFFMISGYYLSPNGIITKIALIKKIKHILSLIIFAEVYYGVFHVVYYIYIEGHSLVDELKTHIRAASLLKFAVTNTPLIYRHLWFLLALVYSYLLILIISGIKRKTGVEIYTISRVFTMLFCLCHRLS